MNLLSKSLKHPKKLSIDDLNITQNESKSEIVPSNRRTPIHCNSLKGQLERNVSIDFSECKQHMPQKNIQEVATSSSRRSIKNSRSREKHDKNEINRSDSSKSLRKIVDQVDYFSDSQSNIGGEGLFISKSLLNKTDAIVNKTSSEYYNVNGIIGGITATPFEIDK